MAAINVIGKVTWEERGINYRIELRSNVVLFRYNSSASYRFGRRLITPDIINKSINRFSCLENIDLYFQLSIDRSILVILKLNEEYMYIGNKKKHIIIE